MAAARADLDAQVASACGWRSPIPTATRAPIARPSAVTAWSYTIQMLKISCVQMLRAKQERRSRRIAAALVWL